jgi:hypothetical protein
VSYVYKVAAGIPRVGVTTRDVAVERQSYICLVGILIRIAQLANGWAGVTRRKNDTEATITLRNSFGSSTWPSGQIRAEVTGMRTIIAIVMTIALLALGGVAGYTVQTHQMQVPILADGGNGPGG